MYNGRRIRTEETTEVNQEAKEAKEMIFEIITAILCVLALFQPTHDRRVIAFVYALACTAHGIFCVNFEGFWYFFSAGVFDLSIISIVYAYGARTRLTDDLINICVASIALNAYGWVAWYTFQSIFSYQIAMAALYFIAIFSLLRKERANEFGINKWASGVRFFVDKSLAYITGTQKEARS